MNELLVKHLNGQLVSEREEEEHHRKLNEILSKVKESYRIRDEK